jgi:hypothetical protein
VCEKNVAHSIEKQTNKKLNKKNWRVCVLRGKKLKHAQIEHVTNIANIHVHVHFDRTKVQMFDCCFAKNKQINHPKNSNKKINK